MLRIGRVTVFSPTLFSLLIIEALLILMALLASEFWPVAFIIGGVIILLACTVVVCHLTLRLMQRGGFVFYNAYRHAWLLKIDRASFEKLPDPLI